MSLKLNPKRETGLPNLLVCVSMKPLSWVHDRGTVLVRESDVKVRCKHSDLEHLITRMCSSLVLQLDALHHPCVTLYAIHGRALALASHFGCLD